MPSRKPPPREKTNWLGLLLGWIFIVAGLFGIVVMILSARPEGRMVCDPGASPSLTKFGSCHMEK